MKNITNGKTFRGTVAASAGVLLAVSLSVFATGPASAEEYTAASANGYLVKVGDYDDHHYSSDGYSYDRHAEHEAREAHEAHERRERERNYDRDYDSRRAHHEHEEHEHRGSYDR